MFCGNRILNFVFLIKITRVKVFYGTSEYNYESAVITAGMFDGVHLGHQALIARTITNARQLGIPSVVVTYHPHPRIVLKKSVALELLTTQNERLKRFEVMGVDAVVILEFTPALATLTAEEFLTKILIKTLKMSMFIVGYDHRFGKDRDQSYADYKHICSGYGVKTERVEAYYESAHLVSSSVIRDSLRSGEIVKANAMLGYEYMLSGTVVKGVQIGRTIGFPTANVQPDDDFKLIPLQGVYACWAEYEGLRYPAMMNIGYRPTLNNDREKMTIEVHILNFEGDLYGSKLTVHIASKIRNEMAFRGLEELKMQLKKDEHSALELLKWERHL